MLKHYYHSFKQLQANQLESDYIITPVTLNYWQLVSKRILHNFNHNSINHNLQDNISNKVTYKTTQMGNHTNTTLTCHLIHTVQTSFNQTTIIYQSVIILKSTSLDKIMASFD